MKSVCRLLKFRKTLPLNLPLAEQAFQLVRFLLRSTMAAHWPHRVQPGHLQLRHQLLPAQPQSLRPFLLEC